MKRDKLRFRFYVVRWAMSILLSLHEVMQLWFWIKNTRGIHCIEHQDKCDIDWVKLILENRRAKDEKLRKVKI